MSKEGNSGAGESGHTNGGSDNAPKTTPGIATRALHKVISPMRKSATATGSSTSLNAPATSDSATTPRLDSPTNTTNTSATKVNASETDLGTESDMSSLSAKEKNLKNKDDKITTITEPTVSVDTSNNISQAVLSPTGLSAQNDGDFDSVFAGTKTMTEAIIEHHRPKDSHERSKTGQSHSSATSPSSISGGDVSGSANGISQQVDSPNSAKSGNSSKTSSKQTSPVLNSPMSSSQRTLANGSPSGVRSSLSNIFSVLRPSKYSEGRGSHPTGLNTKTTGKGSGPLSPLGRDSDRNREGYEYSDNGAKSPNSHKVARLHSKKFNFAKARLMGNQGGEFASSSAPTLNFTTASGHDAEEEDDFDNSKYSYSRTMVNAADDIDDMMKIGRVGKESGGINKSNSTESFRNHRRFNITQNNAQRKSLAESSASSQVDLDADSILLSGSIVGNVGVASVKSVGLSGQSPISDSIIAASSQYVLPFEGGDIDELLSRDPEPIADEVASLPYKLRDVADLLDGKRDATFGGSNNHKETDYQDDDNSEKEEVCVTMDDRKVNDINNLVNQIHA